MSRPRPRTHEERILLAHVLDVPLTRLALVDEVTPQQRAQFDELVERRATGVPLQHLTGIAHFRTVSLKVGPGVFIPRPETESMVEWVMARAPKGAVVVELCAGSGAISKALATERSDLELHAVELSDEALAFAERNLAGTGVDLVGGDMADSFPELNARVDLVVANPPYVPLTAWEYVPAEVRDFDPHLALFSGDDGLDAMRVVSKVTDRLLKEGGWLAAEHAEVQSEQVVELFAQAGFTAVRDQVDLNGRPRFITAQKPTRGKIAP